jgi:hypothetical protein
VECRERFLEVMRFNPGVRPPKWEFGYWGETIDNWYAQGLPRRRYPKLSSEVTTPTSSLYVPAWNTVKGHLPFGIAVMAGGLYWPTQGFPEDEDVRDYFGMDRTQVLVDVNLLFEPMFDLEIVSEDEQYYDYIDLDGVKRRFMRESQTMPSGLEWPIRDWESWQKIKDERIDVKDVSRRFPPNWGRLVDEYRRRDYPLALGGYPHGFFGTLANLMGYETLFVSYHTDPRLVHDVVATFTELWIAVYSEVLARVPVDHFHIWEDISYGSGSMVSPEGIREFILPYMKRVIDFLKSRGVEIILLDTDGYCMDIIPLFIEAGITGMYPFERHCGMDIVEVRKRYPQLQMLGGIPKSEIALGKKRIDQMLEPVEQVLATGGYIPFGDHFVPPEVDWENFCYYRTRMDEIIDAVGT